jgi:hypothetical protein
VCMPAGPAVPVLLLSCPCAAIHIIRVSTHVSYSYMPKTMLQRAHGIWTLGECDRTKYGRGRPDKQTTKHKKGQNPKLFVV